VSLASGVVIEENVRSGDCAIQSDRRRHGSVQLYAMSNCDHSNTGVPGRV